MAKRIEQPAEAMDTEWPDAVEQTAEPEQESGWRITSTADSVYCCGMTHPEGERVIPLDYLTAAQVEEIAAHPDLTIERVGG